MIKVQGKYTEAKVFTEIPQDAALEQIKEMCSQPHMEGLKVRIMPDYHAGKGCVIGTTIAIKDKVVPNFVGVDLGCGLITTKLNLGEVDFEKLDGVVREYMPSGSEIHEDDRECPEEFKRGNFRAKVLSNDRTAKSLGSLGGGNHFLELSICEEGSYYLTVHTGSRYVGARIAKYYQDEGYKAIKKDGLNKLINELKAQGRYKEIAGRITEHKKENPPVKKDMAYVEGQLFEDYLHDVELSQRYAKRNREEIVKIVIENMGWNGLVVEQFDTVHNYIDTGNKILRKGAVSAQAGERLIIPINMRDGSILAVGKGNAEWNYSAPHGAGRVLSRTKAREQLEVSDFEEEMSGVWSTSVGESTIDEAPDAYKTMGEIMGQIGDTVEVLKIIKPVYNFKATEEIKYYGKKR